jgi:hypothetical protein
MAVMLGELVVRAMLATLQANLNAEIAAIVTERGDSIAMAPVARWFCYDRPDEDSPESVDVEVVESPASFPDYVAKITNSGTARAPVDSHIPIVVRLFQANRTQKASGVMWVRSKRYEAAIVRTIRNTPQLGISSTAGVLANATSSSSGVPTRSSQGRAGMVEVYVTVQLNETNGGETVASGGVPPACTLES